MQEIEAVSTEGVPLLMLEADDAGQSTFFTEACTATNACTTGEGDKDADLTRVKRLALLDQEAELAVTGNLCLSQEELEAINNQDEREYHPRNCAKMNGAAHPYFDGGLQQVTAKSNTAYSFFSSRNNNFSNRDHTMAICVDMEDCSFTKASSAPENAFTPNLARAPANPALLTNDLLAALNIDNDASGSGIKFGCSFEADTRLEDAEVAAIAFGCVLGGAAFSLIAVQAYRRYYGNATPYTAGEKGPSVIRMPGSKSNKNWVAKQGATEMDSVL